MLHTDSWQSKVSWSFGGPLRSIMVYQTRRDATSEGAWPFINDSAEPHPQSHPSVSCSNLAEQSNGRVH